MKKIGLVNLGCPKNLVDLEVMLSFLKNYLITLNPRQADFLIINTCAFIKSARRESIDTIKTILKQKGKNTKVIVTGCFVSKDFKLLKDKFNDIYAWVGVNNLADIKDAIKKGGIYLSSKPFIYKSKNRTVLLNNCSAYVKISDGCNHKCSFCIIPFIKGKYRSRNIEDIVDEVKNLVAAGVKEINLISQDTSYYGKDIYNYFAIDKLLKKILKNIKKYFWLRLMYLYPNFSIINKIVKIMKNDKRVCRYFDLPFQHINTDILSAMHRGYSRNEIERIINFIKKELPDSVIRSSFITGYPGETKKQFNELLFFIKNGKIDKPGFFKYSDEKGTQSFNCKNKISKDVINKRFKILTLAAKKISNYDSNGVVKKVLITGIKNKNLYTGRTQTNAPDIDDYLLVSSKESLQTGNFYDIKTEKKER